MGKREGREKGDMEKAKVRRNAEMQEEQGDVAGVAMVGLGKSVECNCPDSVMWCARPASRSPCASCMCICKVVAQSVSHITIPETNNYLARTCRLFLCMSLSELPRLAFVFSPEKYMIILS